MALNLPGLGRHLRSARRTGGNTSLSPWGFCEVVMRPHHHTGVSPRAGLASAGKAPYHV